VLALFPRRLPRLVGVPEGNDADGNDPDVGPGERIDDAAFVSQELPATLQPGEAFAARFTFRNTGTSTWSDPVRLATIDNDDTRGPKHG